MRSTRRSFMLSALVCLAACAPGFAQSSSSGRWLPRLSEIFGSNKTAEAADKKKTSSQPAKAPTAAKTPASATRTPVIKDKTPVSPFDPPEPTSTETTVVVEEKSSRLMEIVVEMALLSDSLTFPCLLEARVEGQAVKIQGHVPSKAVRERALKLVQLNCPLQVVDAMKEHPGSVPPRSARPDPRTLEDSALTALKQSLPGDDRNFEVKCGTDGRTEVSGFVRSFEEKLKVSQTLRRLHGCACVLNKVHVLADEGVRPASAPAKQTPNTKKAETPRYGPRIDAVSSTVLPALDRETEQPVKLATPIKEAKFKAPPAKENQLEGWASTKAPEKVPADARWRSSSGRESAAPKAEKQVAATAEASREQKAGPSSAVQQTRFTAQPAADPVPTPMSTAPLPFPNVGAAVSQNDSLATATTKVEAPTRQVTNGVPSNRFKQIVEAACGASVRDVSVEVISPTDLLVQFRVRNENEARQVARRILSLPELDRYRVEVRAKVPQ